jgi:DNA-nicking Smr family endonuclease
MKVGGKAQEAELWARVAATVTPLAPRPALEAPNAAPPVPVPRVRAAPRARVAASPPTAREAGGSKRIEPGRLRRIVRGAEAIEGRIDLHGMDQDRARSVLTAFILRAHQRRARAVLVITGKGGEGGGVLRRRAPQWLCAPPLVDAVAGIATAHPKDGGGGALYVALRRRAGPR